MHRRQTGLGDDCKADGTDDGWCEGPVRYVAAYLAVPDASLARDGEARSATKEAGASASRGRMKTGAISRPRPSSYFMFGMA